MLYLGVAIVTRYRPSLAPKSSYDPPHRGVRRAGDPPPPSMCVPVRVCPAWCEFSTSSQKTARHGPVSRSHETRTHTREVRRPPALRSMTHGGKAPLLRKKKTPVPHPLLYSTSFEARTPRVYRIEGVVRRASPMGPVTRDKDAYNLGQAGPSPTLSNSRGRSPLVVSFRKTSRATGRGHTRTRRRTIPPRSVESAGPSPTFSKVRSDTLPWEENRTAHAQSALRVRRASPVTMAARTESQVQTRNGKVM